MLIGINKHLHLWRQGWSGGVMVLGKLNKHLHLWRQGWSGGVMVLGKLPVPERPATCKLALPKTHHS